MEIKQVQLVRRYIDVLFRSKTLIIGLVLIGVTAGLAYYLIQPKIYTSSALLSYQQQQINPTKMSPDARERIHDIVSTLTQIITSRTSLESIINELNLYEEALKNLPMEDVVESMRKKIDISPSRRGDTFRISFRGTNPEKIARVVNTLAAKFIEENLKYREKRASDTFGYTRSELEMAKEMLDGKEEVMRDYKLQFYNEMPEQRANNMGRLNALQEQYQNRQESIQDLERTRVLIRDQLAMRKKIVEEVRVSRAISGRNNSDTLADRNLGRDEIADLETKLSLMLERYTEKHPAVRRLQKQIEYMKETLAANAQNTSSSADGTADGSEQFDQGVFDLQMQLKEIGLNIQRLNQEKKEIQVAIKKYEKWVESAPVRGAEWAALTREYGELKRRYDYLVAQNLQARSALNLERKQRGSQFEIEDPARNPLKPIEPNFLKILALAVIASGGLGCALALGRDIVDSSFKDPSEIEDFLGIELICTVPQLDLKREQRKRVVLNSLVFLIIALYGISLFAAFIYFYKNGQIVI